MNNRNRTNELKFHNNNGRKIPSIDEAREHVRAYEENYRIKYGDSLLALSLTRKVLEVGGLSTLRRNFFEVVRHYATSTDPVFIGTIDNFLKDGNVERIVGNVSKTKYGRGKYAGV